MHLRCKIILPLLRENINPSFAIHVFVSWTTRRINCVLSLFLTSRRVKPLFLLVREFHNHLFQESCSENRSEQYLQNIYKTVRCNNIQSSTLTIFLYNISVLKLYYKRCNPDITAVLWYMHILTNININ